MLLRNDRSRHWERACDISADFVIRPSKYTYKLLRVAGSGMELLLTDSH